MNYLKIASKRRVFVFEGVIAMGRGDDHLLDACFLKHSDVSLPQALEEALLTCLAHTLTATNLFRAQDAKIRPGLFQDIGCGPGYLIAVIAKSLPHLSIIGVDIAEEMLQKAANNMSSLGLSERVSFRQGDIQKLPFEDDSLDFVISTLSLHHWSDPEKALPEIYRVLKPGGQFLIFDLRRDCRRFFYWIIWFAQTFVVPAAIRNVNEPTGSALSSYTPAEMETILWRIPFEHWAIKPGFGWMFVLGRKG